MLHWIARFGCRLNLTTDRGGQFCSESFNNFCINFGINLKNTTAYHPTSNGIIENTHRTIKAALKGHENPLNWHSNLGLVLLGFRCTYKPDVSQTEYSKQLTKFMSLQSFIPRSQPAIRSFLDPALDTCTHVFVKVDAKKGPLYPHYEGPFIIVEKRTKYFVLLMNGRVNSVSIDRLKIAHLPRVAVSGSSPTNNDDVPTTSQYAHATDNPPSSLTDCFRITKSKCLVCNLMTRLTDFFTC